MKPAPVIAALTAIAAACWLARPGGQADAPLAPQAMDSPPAQAAGPPPRAPGLQWMADLPAQAPPPAWHSMDEARRHGDARMPPLQTAGALEAGPAAALLADPDAYRAQERMREREVLSSFATAVEAEVPRLRADVARARAAGIAPDEIAKVEAKIARLEKLRAGILETGTVPD